MNWLTRILILGFLQKLRKRMEESNMHTGFLSSEFLVTVIGGCLTVILTAMKIDPAITNKIVALVVAYIGSRTLVKITNDADGK